jgi:hypothetical protein
MAKQVSRVYPTITGQRIPLTRLSGPEKELLARVRQKYNSRLEWMRFAAWWNAEFSTSGLSGKSPVYRICQDLEARLGIHQGSVSAPDYRDFLADLIEGRFGSRLEFCQAPLRGTCGFASSLERRNRNFLPPRLEVDVLRYTHRGLV